MARREFSFPEVLRMLRREVTPFVKRKLAVVLALVVTAAMLTALAPVALKMIIDGFNATGRIGTVSPFLLVALYVISQWLARAAGEIRQLMYGQVERRMFRTLSERLFAHLMHLSLRFHLERETGAVSETLSNGLEGFQIVLHHLVFTVLPVTAELGTVLIVLWRLAPPLFLALFCGALVFYASAFIYSAATLSASARTASAARVQASAALVDGLLNYETVKYFTAEAQIQARVGNALAHSETEWIAFYRRYAYNGLLVASVFALFLVTTTWYAVVDVHNGRMTVGDFVLVNTYILQLVRPVEMLGYALQGLSQGMAMLEKLMQVFREAPETASKITVHVTSGHGTLQFDHVSLSYHKDRPVLHDISFRLAPKRTLAIVGPSGSGKSTLVRLLMRLLEPDAGQILLDEVPIKDLPLSYLRGAIAVVPQDTVLFNDTLARNIALGSPHSDIADIQQAARVARLHDFIMTSPHGYDTPVGERGLKLSGGERQRVSIARAVLKSPRIYVFDEATSSLDSQTEQDILGSLRDIARHSSTLVIAHRLSTVAYADEICVLEGGYIVERGDHANLIHGEGRYATMWLTQHHGAATA